MALEAVENGTTHSLGPLIHNPQMVEELSARGVLIADKAEYLKSATVIVRSHGITETERRVLNGNDNTIIDATCPYVRRTHEIVREMSEAGYPVMIMGDEQHPEVTGMLSYGNEQTLVVSPDYDPHAETWQQLCLLSQTTMQMQDLQALAGRLLPQCQEIRIFNTICLATTERQNASRYLAQKVDLMIVIGGKNSSNTRMLYDISTTYTPTLHIETADEITTDLLAGVQTIGLTAGASTPDVQIIKVYNKIIEINGNGDRVTEINAIPIFKEESC